MLLILPILIPLLAAAGSLLWHHQTAVKRWLCVGGSAGLLLAALALMVRVRIDGIQTVQVGDWPAPFGITLVADHLSALMVLVTGVIGLAVTVYSIADIDELRQSFGYFPLLQLMLMGVCAAFLAGDLFNLYVWFEVLLISSFVLLALGSGRGQLEGALKYVTMNLIASFLFLTAVALVYGLVGTLNMADIGRKLPLLENQAMVTPIAMLLLVAFGLKAAVFPLFFWLPASYHTPPAAVSAVFAGLLTKVGVYALIRAFTLMFTLDVPTTHTTILVLSGFTMLTGVLGAVAQSDVRRILSFHIISQIGYMTLGLGLFTPLGLAGAVYYIVHHILVKTNLFLVSGVMRRHRGTDELSKTGGLYAERPWLALLFAIPACSLAGIPPLSGFVAKLGLVTAGLEVGRYTIVAVAVIVGLLTLYSMTKIWSEAFWKPYTPEPSQPDVPVSGEVDAVPPSRREQVILLGPVVALASLTIAMGLGAGFAFPIALVAAEELLNPAAYIDAVLGTGVESLP